ncbi:MAG: metallophosphoesterase [Paenibacillaceae bacterium]|nr:metallophosphoesterase [Paenibacillaceae bacterium]
MKLILMGDLHYHQADEAVPEWLEARDEFYRILVDRYMALEGDAHIALGDLTNYGRTEELQEVYRLINRHTRNFYHVLGNHDLYAQPRKRVLELTGQARYRSLETDEAVLVFLDTAKEMDFEDWGGVVDDRQLAWLSDVIDASGEKPLLVFAHHPVYDTTARSTTEKASVHKDIPLWTVLQRKKGAGVYFNGHTHVDSIARKENWTFVQVSACLDQHAFRVVEISGSEIRISALDVDAPELHLQTPVIFRHMEHFRPTPEERGTELDRETVITLVRGAEAAM